MDLSALEDQSSLTSIISAIPKYTSILFAIIVCLSIIHEYAYFFIIGREFITIYSAADFLKLAIYWILALVLFSAIGLIVNYYDESRRLSAYLSDPEAAARTYKYPDISMRLLRILFLCTGLLGLAFISFNDTQALQIVVTLALLYIAGILLKKGKIPITNRPIAAGVFYTTVVIFSVYALFGGVREAIFDLRKQAPQFKFVSSNLNGDKPIIVLRAVDRGVLFRQVDVKRISFVPWDDVKLLQSEDVLVSEKKLYEKITDLFK